MSNDWRNILVGGGCTIIVWIIGRIVIDNRKRTKKIEKEWEERELVKSERRKRKKGGE